MKSVKEFLIQRGLPKSTKIKRIAENNEPVVFKQYFESWKEPSIEPQNDEVFNKGQEVNANVQNDDPLPLPHKATDQQVKKISYQNPKRNNRLPRNSSIIQIRIPIGKAFNFYL